MYKIKVGIYFLCARINLTLLLYNYKTQQIYYLNRIKPTKLTKFTLATLD